MTYFRLVVGKLACSNITAQDDVLQLSFLLFWAQNLVKERFLFYGYTNGVISVHDIDNVASSISLTLSLSLSRSVCLCLGFRLRSVLS